MSYERHGAGGCGAELSLHGWIIGSFEVLDARLEVGQGVWGRCKSGVLTGEKDRRLPWPV